MPSKEILPNIFPGFTQDDATVLAVLGITGIFAFLLFDHKRKLDEASDAAWRNLLRAFGSSELRPRD